MTKCWRCDVAKDKMFVVFGLRQCAACALAMVGRVKAVTQGCTVPEVYFDTGIVLNKYTAIPGEIVQLADVRATAINQALA